MKFLYVTDTHFRKTTPENRTDDYFATSLRKLSDVVAYAKRNNAEFILHGGDFFDSARIGAEVIAAVGEVMREGPSWLLNVGQHDLIDHDPSSIKKTAIWAMTFLPNVTLLQNGIPFDRYPLTIVATWFDTNRSKEHEFYELHGIRNKEEFIVHTAHGLLADAKTPMQSVLLNDLVSTEANLFLGSDYHPGWPNRYVRECLYAAPGSMMRNAITKRLPLFFDIDVEAGSTRILRIPLSQEVPFEAAKKTEAHEVEAVDMVSLIDNAFGESVTPEGILAAVQEGYTKEEIELAFKLVRESAVEVS